jgi:uncharacterized membrane protein YhaH (DUF805 family)
MKVLRSDHRECYVRSPLDLHSTLTGDHVSFQDAVTTVLTKKYADFSGRARRSEYWFFALAYVLAMVVTTIIDAILGTTPIVEGLAFLGLIIPLVGAGVRRLHDTGRSGWWILLGLIPFGGLVVLYFSVLDSEPGDNQYGPSPKGGAGFNTAPSANWGQS